MILYLCWVLPVLAEALSFVHSDRISIIGASAIVRQRSAMPAAR